MHIIVKIISTIKQIFIDMPINTNGASYHAVKLWLLGIYAFPIATSPGLYPHAQHVSRNNHTLTVLLYRYNTSMPVYWRLLSLL